VRWAGTKKYKTTGRAKKADSKLFVAEQRFETGPERGQIDLGEYREINCDRGDPFFNGKLRAEAKLTDAFCFFFDASPSFACLIPLPCPPPILPIDDFHERKEALGFWMNIVSWSAAFSPKTVPEG